MKKKLDKINNQEKNTPTEIRAVQRLKTFAEPERFIASGTATLVVGAYVVKGKKKQEFSSTHSEYSGSRSTEARIAEAKGLAEAIDLQVVQTLIAPLADINPGTYIGKGKAEEIEMLIKERDIHLVVLDCALSPIQQRNLERKFQAKVIDRTGLILEIFGRRAHTKEGLLQVEHAHLAYQKGRLVRSWTHLERQRGGFGFLGGPGETQIEADRRMIQERMGRIEKELEGVKKTRALHRAGRKRIPFPTISFVGYTNAGKSTLFNQLTEASVLAENMLFATLDPTSRAIKLPFGETAILSDTVGFISDLPTTLISAFQATLEDVRDADILLHVRDISDPETEMQAEDVRKVLEELDINPLNKNRIIEIWNKTDLLSPDDLEKLLKRNERRPINERALLVSALTGDRTIEILEEVDRRLALTKIIFNVSLKLEDGKSAAWLHQHTEVLERKEQKEYILFKIRLQLQKREEFLNKFPEAQEQSL